MAEGDDGSWTVVENKSQKKQKGTTTTQEDVSRHEIPETHDSQGSKMKRPGHVNRREPKKVQFKTSEPRGELNSPPQKRGGILVLKNPLPRPDPLDDPIVWPSLPSAASRDSLSPGTSVSYSRVAKRSPAAKQPPLVPSPSQDDHGAPSSEGDGPDGEEDKTKKRKKKKKKKKTSEGTQEQPSEHKAYQPILFDISSMLEACTSGAGGQVGSGSKKSGTGGAKTTPTQASSLPPSKRLGSESVAANPLDSSAPLRRRGKEREEPKKKHPSAMRRVLLKEREERLRMRESGQEIPQNLDVTVNQAEEASEETERNAIAVEIKSRPKHFHTRQYREYCDQVADPGIDSLVEILLKELGRFQDRVYMKEPQKFKLKRRFVCGLREVAKHLKLRKLKAVIVAQNLDRITSTGGIDDVVVSLIELTREQGIPIVYALTRQSLGRTMKKKVPISAVGIFNYDGAERYYKELLLLVEKARELYQTKVAEEPVRQGSTDLTAQQQQQQQQHQQHQQQQQHQRQQHQVSETSDSAISYQMCAELMLSLKLHSKKDGNHGNSDDTATPQDRDSRDVTPTHQATSPGLGPQTVLFNVNAPVFRPSFAHAWPQKHS